MKVEEETFRNMANPELAQLYRRKGWWGDVTVADLVDRWADEKPDGDAIVTLTDRMSWRGYRDASNWLAQCLVAAGIDPGEKVAVFLPDGASVHVAFLANEKAGAITVGIGARSGHEEIRHLLRRTGAVAIITLSEHRQEDMTCLVDTLRSEGIAVRKHIVVPIFEAGLDSPIVIDGIKFPYETVDGAQFLDRHLGPDDLFMINSTSGTTGLPKCVMHTQNSKLYMAHQACEAGQLRGDEVLLGLAPVPFGFGLFTTHFVTALLGAATVVLERFSADSAIEVIEREKVTVLVCVSTQFKMMLNSPEILERGVSSLRVMFTGGEMIPYDAARNFEKVTGSIVLNFYGSNESGFATGTRVTDSPEHRLRTGGSKLAGTDVRLFDEGLDVTDLGRGQPGSRGPSLCLGYYDDPEANAQLFTPDGYLLHADIVTLDDEGFLTVVGRKSEIIIRGGKNISAAVVEDLVSTHPAVALAAAVPMPDPVFGEKVCVFVELRPGTTVDLAGLLEFLSTSDASKENYPERLVVLDELPRSSGGKVAKGVLTSEAAKLAAVNT